MQYLECKISLLSNASAQDSETLMDIFSYQLGELGFDSFDQEGEILHAYIQKEKFDEASIKAKFLKNLPEGVEIKYEITECEDKNWNEVWEKNYFKPLRIDDLVVRASFHEPMPAAAEEIIIDPRMAFGTGNHGTTASMLRLLRGINVRGKSVIDMGCGSGILGIYAMKLGAKHCFSVDFDIWSVDNTRENARLNEVQLEVIHGDAAALAPLPQVDIFLANINRNIILRDLPYYLEHIHRDGALLLSGFYADDIPVLEEKGLHKYGWYVVESKEENGWVALSCRHTP